MMHILFAFVLLTSACSSSQMKNINAKMDSTLNPNKVLIVYLSRTNNTKDNSRDHSQKCRWNIGRT